jgi:hypothetical protein
MICAQDRTLGHEGEALNVTGTSSDWLEFDVIPIKNYAVERCAE